MEARGAKIESVTSKPTTNYRPQPMDTVQLEKLAVRKLKMSAKQAMDIAEKLYNKGYISYPRYFSSTQTIWGRRRSRGGGAGRGGTGERSLCSPGTDPLRQRIPS
ncbi:hypothetical protein COOONC_03543 [Cooperia oncophora]